MSASDDGTLVVFMNKFLNSTEFHSCLELCRCKFSRVFLGHCGTLSPVVVDLRYLVELNCTKFYRPRMTQVQFRTALTAVYVGGENSWNSSIKVGGAVAESGRGSDTKIRAHFTVR